jgi:hypothetical protein
LEFYFCQQDGILMARGRTIYRGLPASDKYNHLISFPLGELAQLIYHESYPYSDDWGHLPYSASWMHRTCFPDSRRTVGELEQAMEHLVAVGLWEYVYDVFGKKYLYIYLFESKNGTAIHKRSSGEYPDESGAIPRRLYIHGRQEPLEDSLKRSEIVRKSYYSQVINIGNNFPVSDKMAVSRETSCFPEHSGTFRKVSVELSRVELSRVELIKEPESPVPVGSLKKNESNQSASSTERKSPEVFGGNLSKNTDNSTQNISCSGQGMPQTLSRSLSTV